ncbi:MAG: type II secretion system F family protein, partial [Gemmataceae bacterium]|nr:type II secretion system F family protein [Gemmataceae bacterium]
LVAGGRKNRLDARLEKLTERPGNLPEPAALKEFARSTLPRVGAPLMPRDEEERTRLQTRLIQAGFYSRQAMAIFLGVKMLLMVGPTLIGLALALAGLIPLRDGLVYGALLGITGMIGPSFWLDRRKADRQTRFRRALPDALDVLVICLEGGLSLIGSLRRVAGELRTAHPLLARELHIVQREIQMGRAAGEALQHFAERCDLEEVRSLASVIGQAERFGASIVKGLRSHAEILREKRLVQAEEMAQKAATKLLIPTILFIFPGVFIVVLAPAVIQVVDMLARLKR